MKSAEALGQWIGSHGHTLVYGGVNAGLMHTVAQATHDAGGKVIGIIPERFRSRADELNDEVIFTADLAERKATMIEMANLFVVLPGGIGTLDEFIETMTLRKLERYMGELYVLNVKGFYEPFRQLLDYYVSTGMLDAESRALVHFVPDAETLAGLLGRKEKI